MVSYNEILAANASVKVGGLTAVFIGATQGIGLSTLKAFAKYTTSPKVYVLGRSETTLNKIIDDLKVLNRSGTYYPIKCTDLSLLRAVDEASNLLINHPTDPPKKIDILCNSAGFMHFGSRTETAEGLDCLMSIRFYSRARFFDNLAPLIRAAGTPRVISVLAAGKESQLWADDLELKKHYSVMNMMNGTGSMNSLYLEELATQPENKNISFIHTFPGVVTDTGIFRSNHIGPLMQFLINWILGPLISLFMGMTSEQSGERIFYEATSPAFGEGGKAHLVTENSDEVKASKALENMRADGFAAKVYEHTQEELARVGKVGSS